MSRIHRASADDQKRFGAELMNEWRTRRLRATIGFVKGNRELAAWLISHRKEIEALMTESLGPAAPSASSPEAEALRRFRSFAASAIQRGVTSTPALDGLRLNQRRTEALLDAWIAAVARLAGDQGLALREALTPLAGQFRVHIRTEKPGRKARGTPRAKRRAVVAAIDRLSEAFLAIDTDSGTIEDANPAAGSLLGLNRDTLLGVDAMSFIPECARSFWWNELDAVGEGNESRTFSAEMVDSQGATLDLEASATRFTTRGKTLALVLMRPRAHTPL